MNLSDDDTAKDTPVDNPVEPLDDHEDTLLPNPNAEGQELEPEQSVPIDPESLARHYEQHDVDVRALVRFGAGIGVATVVACVVLWLVLRSWTTEPLPAQIQLPPALVTPPMVAGPGLDAAPEANLEILLEAQRARLAGYGWVDRDAGRVHIPIEEAMRLLVERGLPAREGDAPTFGLDPAFRLDSSGGVMVEAGAVEGVVDE